MKAKIENIKSKRHKEPHEMTFIEKIAAACGCSPRMAAYIISKRRRAESKLAERIEVAAVLIKEKDNLLLQEVKRVVQF